MHKYICGTCYVVSDEDFWYCVNCSDTSMVHQVIFSKNERSETVRFHKDVSYPVASSLLPYLVAEDMNLSHSQFTGDNYQDLMFTFTPRVQSV